MLKNEDCIYYLQKKFSCKVTNDNLENSFVNNLLSL